jgi:homoserine kinase type II
MTVDLIPVLIRRDWLEPWGVCAIEPAPVGMSGAHVFRCQTIQGDCLALKRWPSTVSRQRVDQVHFVINAARQNHCPLVAEVHGVRQADGHCWDLVRWLPGAPLPVTASLESIQVGAAAIARFHHAVATLGQTTQVAPALSERINKLRQSNRQLSLIRQEAVRARLAPPLEQAVQRAMSLFDRNWSRVRPRLSHALSNCASRPLLTQFVMRDVHRDHVLFAGNQVSGLIDFDALRIDSRAVDLARWAGSFWIGTNGQPRPCDELLQAVVAGYDSERTLKQQNLAKQEVDAVHTLFRVNPWLSLVNWLGWVVIEQRSFAAGPIAIARQIESLASAASRGGWGK